MTWKYDDSKNSDLEFIQRFTNFLQSCLTQRGSTAEAVRPQWVPGLIRIKKTVVSDTPEICEDLKPGVYVCDSNQWGAISVTTVTGNRLGIRPSECVVMSMVSNPHSKD